MLLLSVCLANVCRENAHGNFAIPRSGDQAGGRFAGTHPRSIAAIAGSR